MDERHWILRPDVIGYGVPCLLGTVTVAVVAGSKWLAADWPNGLHVAMFNQLLSVAAGVAGGILSSDRPATRFWGAIKGAVAGYVLNLAVTATLGNIVLWAWAFANT